MEGAELKFASDKSYSLGAHYLAIERLFNAGRKEGYPLLAFS